MSELKRPNKHWPDEQELSALHAEAPNVDLPQSDVISLSSVWRMQSPEDADAALAGRTDRFVYRRDGHPNDRTLAQRLCQLHGGKAAALGAQGMSVISAAFLAMLKPGDTVWAGTELYGRTHRLLHSDMKKWGIHVEQFDATDRSDIDRVATLGKCSLAIIETITNPCIRVADVALVAEKVHAAGGKLMVDNTFASHLVCPPLSLGADLVVESLGKIVNGHSDTMLGLLVGQDAELVAEIKATIGTFGMASSPLDCYLTQRSLMSLSVRMERSCQNAQALAEFLAEQPAIASVAYPGLESHPQHELATEMLTGGYGWMLSAELDENGAVESAESFFERLAPEIGFVPSLGDTVTTVSHPHSTSHRSLSPEQQSSLGITPRTIRISCGIEPTNWLLQRFSDALDG